MMSLSTLNDDTTYSYYDYYCQHCQRYFMIAVGYKHDCPLEPNIDDKILTKLDRIIYLLERIEYSVETIRLRS